MAYTTENLISAIERRSFAPANQSTFSPEEILLVADEEIQTTIMPVIFRTYEEFYIYKKEISIVAGQSRYPLPDRAIGMTARRVKLKNESGNYRDIPRIASDKAGSDNVSTPAAFYMQNNDVVLYPTPSSSTGTLVIWFALAPGEMVKATDSALIQSIDRTTGNITVASSPSSWVAGSQFDFIKGRGGQEYVEIDIVAAGISGVTFSVAAADIPDTLVAGDYIARQGKAPLVQLPPEFRPILAQASAANVLESSNQPGAKAAREKTEVMLKQILKIISPRTSGAPKFITNDIWS